MIISHKYKYLFVELPYTATRAIHEELLHQYHGEKILNKHATYLEFLKGANEEEKKYFVFSGIRNPLDVTVSRFLLYKADKNSRYSSPVKRRAFYIRLRDRLQFDFVQNPDTGFADWFKRFYKIPYNNWSALSHRSFDFVIRFENIQADFSEVLAKLKIEQKRPLPARGKTPEKKRDFVSFYTPEIIPRAKRIFGPFMKEWGYQYPPTWGDIEIPWRHQLEYDVSNWFRLVFWKHLRPLIR